MVRGQLTRVLEWTNRRRRTSTDVEPCTVGRPGRGRGRGTTRDPDPVVRHRPGPTNPSGRGEGHGLRPEGGTGSRTSTTPRAGGRRPEGRTEGRPRPSGAVGGGTRTTGDTPPSRDRRTRRIPAWSTATTTTTPRTGAAVPERGPGPRRRARGVTGSSGRGATDSHPGRGVPGLNPVTPVHDPHT